MRKVQGGQTNGEHCMVSETPGSSGKGDVRQARKEGPKSEDVWQNYEDRPRSSFVYEGFKAVAPGWMVTDIAGKGLSRG
jgi:hypothetical protein